MNFATFCHFLKSDFQQRMTTAVFFTIGGSKTIGSEMIWSFRLPIGASEAEQLTFKKLSLRTITEANCLA